MKIGTRLADVDLNSFAWFNIAIPGPIPVPKLSATMVAVENRLFVFGGRTKYEDDSPFLSTFSVACYNGKDGWSWQCVDHQYPPHIPNLGCSVQAAVINDGKTILLHKGWIENTEAFQFSDITRIFFNVANFTMNAGSAMSGNLPQNVSWHILGTSSLQPKSSTFAFAAWAVYEDGFAPDIWLYVPHEGRLHSLDIQERLSSLKLDLQSFAVINSRVILLGSTEGKIEELEKMDCTPPGRLPTWNTAVEVIGLEAIPV
ncbi:hypothetical protein R3P38DRAFT_2787519 [Favolaschia claudopus]|uniref:Uncharacterized protein n=1 Tax=Favolaschia claudopus TaxID=2862362 RepID=A0AAW0AQH7_9AGAR